MNTIDSIPLKYLVSWARAHRDSHPGLTFLNTIAAKNPSLLSDPWRSVEAILLPSKSLRDLMSALHQCESDIEKDYNDDSTLVVLPANAASYDCFYDRVNAYVREYRMEKEWELAHWKVKHADGVKNSITVFRETFEHEPLRFNPAGRDVLSAQIGTSRQRVDQILNDLSAENEVILSGGQVGRAVADPLLVAEFKAFRDRIGSMASFESFCIAAGAPFEDRRTLEFLASVLGMRIGGQERGIPFPVVARKGMLGNYANTIGALFFFIRKEVIGIRTDIELVAFLSKIPDQELREAIFSLVLSSEEFVKYDDNGQQAVTLRWDLLQTVPARLTWILYTEGAFDYRSAIHEKDLVKKYNALAKVYGEKKKTVEQLPSKAQAGDCWRPMCLGRTGYWKLRTTPKETYSIDDFIKRFLRQNGVDTPFSVFLSVIKADGQYRFFKSAESIRSRYIMNGGKNLKAPSAVKTASVMRISAEDRKKRQEDIVHILDKEARIMSLQELYTLFLAAYPGTNYATFSLWVRAKVADGKINAIVGTGRMPTYVCSPSIPISRPQSRDDVIRDNAIRLLSAAPNYTLPTKSLYQQLRAALPFEVSSTLQVVSRAIHSSPRLVFDGSAGHKNVKLV